MNRPADMSAPIAALVDAHVHLYAMYDRERFFTAARANFDRARRRLGLPHAQYVMCFTEDSRHDAFGELPGRFGSVEILSTPDQAALRVRFAGEEKDGPEMYVLAGRQIITSEGLELRDGGILADVAPTALDLLGIPQPAPMTGRTLVSE